MDAPPIEQQSAKQRILAALAEQKKTRGLRGSKGEKAFVELRAGDIVEACAAVPLPDAVVTALHDGSAAGDEERPVVIYADDAFHLCDQAAGR
jgi:uncharacterized protein YqfA (UPF0365 family)